MAGEIHSNCSFSPPVELHNLAEQVGRYNTQIWPREDFGVYCCQWGCKLAAVALAAMRQPLHKGTQRQLTFLQTITMSPQISTSVQVPPTLGGYNLYQLLESNAPSMLSKILGVVDY